MSATNNCCICEGTATVESSYYAGGETYHRSCFKCKTCGVLLKIINAMHPFSKMDGPLCDECYEKLHPDLKSKTIAHTSFVDDRIFILRRNASIEMPILFLSCSICAEKFGKRDDRIPVSLHCGHSFHQKCLLSGEKECYICKAEIKTDISTLKPNYALLNVLNIIPDPI